MPIMASDSGSPAKPTLPVQQLTILAVARFAEPLAYTSVFPYLPEMIRDFGVEQNKVARWAGLTSAVFSIAQSITAVPWVKASDYYGRKPVLIAGLISTMITFVIWGMSTSLPMAVIVRAIQGGGNGNVGIIRTMVAELVPEKELQPRAFSVMPLVWSLGSVVGPSFGGFFAQPAKQYPAIFGDIEFFKQFPYALPNLIATIFFLISVASAALFLEETLARKRNHQDWGLKTGKRLARAFKRQRRHEQSHRRTSFVDGEATAPLVPSKPLAQPRRDEPDPTFKDAFTRQTVINLASYTILAFHSVAFDQVVPVFLNYPKQKQTSDNMRFPFYFRSGFGLESGEIGTIFTLYGITCGLIQFILYPSLVSRYGVLRCFRVCSVILPFTYFLLPYTVLFETAKARYITLALIMFVKAGGIIVAFPSTTILLTNSCTSVRVLGTLNGVATAFSGLGRAAGPALTGVMFTWGVDNGYVLAPFAFLAFIAALGAIPVFMIVEGDGPSATPDQSDGEGDDSDTMVESATLLPNESAIEEESDEESGDNENDVQAPLLAGKNGQYGTNGVSK